MLLNNKKMIKGQSGCYFSKKYYIVKGEEIFIEKTNTFVDYTDLEQMIEPEPKKKENK